MAYLLIKCVNGYEKIVAEKLARAKEISEFTYTVGTFDILAKIELSEKGEGLISSILKMKEVHQMKRLYYDAFPALMEIF